MRLSRGLAVVFNVESVIKNRKKKNWCDHEVAVVVAGVAVVVLSTLSSHSISEAYILIF